ncbi:hypothetical protein GDO81_008660 [Engystomops pustulosus]|uniref:Uncharacterized protein n=1 Tax=Engystomops pustulosus TaxID=76066 RepID=A0AAV7CGX0_ENGPU|nr:hypothetical protein GDO81_008660 [Engystomops pustulosus]
MIIYTPHVPHPEGTDCIGINRFCARPEISNRPTSLRDVLGQTRPFERNGLLSISLCDLTSTRVQFHRLICAGDLIYTMLM